MVNIQICVKIPLCIQIKHFVFTNNDKHTVWLIEWMNEWKILNSNVPCNDNLEKQFKTKIA